MDIEKLTIAEARTLAATLAAFLTPAAPTSAAHPYPVGKNVFVRTVTMHYTGHLTRVTDGELVLTDAAWVADSGRFSEALSTGKLNEVEPFPAGEVIVSRAAVVDVCVWAHDLPRAVK